MAHHDDAWLHHQQRRFMRPDAARYIRPDVARFLKPGTDPARVYPALEFKYPGQPRSHGQFSFGRMNAGDLSDDGRARVYITKPDITSDTLGAGDGDGESDDGDDIAGIQLAGDLPDGLGDNEVSRGDDPPQIPRRMPGTPAHRMRFVRTVASWIFRVGRSAPLVKSYFAALDQVEEIDRLTAMIKTANDPPQSLDDARIRARGASEKGYHDHHIVNQHDGNRRKFGDSRIDSRENVVRIPTLQHIEVSRWYNTKNREYGMIPPQQFLRDKSWEEQMRAGLRILRDLGIIR